MNFWLGYVFFCLFFVKGVVCVKLWCWMNMMMVCDWCVVCVCQNLNVIVSKLFVILNMMMSVVMIVSMVGLNECVSIVSDGMLIGGSVISSVVVGLMFMLSDSIVWMIGILLVVGIMNSMFVIVNVMIQLR